MRRLVHVTYAVCRVNRAGLVETSSLEHGVRAEQHPTRPVPGRCPPELRERAVRLVAETAADRGDCHGAVTHVARQLGIGPESARQWVR